MYTLIYLKGQFNRPDTLLPFLQSNIGQSPLLRVDCVSPYCGTEEEIIKEVCEYLNGISPDIDVTYNLTQNISTEDTPTHHLVHFLVIQINVSYR